MKWTLPALLALQVVSVAAIFPSPPSAAIRHPSPERALLISGSRLCRDLNGAAYSEGAYISGREAGVPIPHVSCHLLHGDRDMRWVETTVTQAIEERLDAVCAIAGTQSMIDEGVCKGPMPTR